MKNLSTEIRVGAIAVLIIVLFIWLFSFLKGRNILNSSDNYMIYYSNIAGLNESSPVEMNGMKIGVVSEVELVNNGSGLIEVGISIDNGILIPEDSKALITTATLIAGMKIDLIPGQSEHYLKNNDTLSGKLAVSFLNKLDDGMDPILLRAASLLEKLDSVGTKLNSLLNQEFNDKLSSAVSNIDAASKEFRLTVSDNRQVLSELISNINSISQIVNTNKFEIDSTIKNIYHLSEIISQSDIDTTIYNFSRTLNESKDILNSINKGEGSAGKFFKDDSLYINLTRSLESLNLLLKDMEDNPGRYVQFSIFGNKKK